MKNNPAPIGFTAVRYVGKRAEYTEGMYGTRLHFVQGESRMVPSDKARLLLKHPDQYAPGEMQKELPAPEPELPDENDEVQILRDAVANMDKDALAQYTKIHYNVDVDKRKGVDFLRSQLTGLIDQYGVV